MDRGAPGARAGFRMPPCIVTAAGASSRMPNVHKLLLPWPPARSIVEAAVAAPLEAGSPVVLVLGNRAEDIEALFAHLSHRAPPGSPSILIVRNPDWKRGMLGSIQAGLAALIEAWPDADSWFSHHADMPLVTATSFRVLAEASAAAAARQAETRQNTVPLLAAFRGRAGKPALVPSHLNRAILDLDPEGQLKPFLMAHGAEIVETGDSGVLVDIDNPDDYARHVPRR